MGVQQVAEFLAGLDEGQEHHRFAAFAALGHLGGNLFQIGVKRSAEVSHGVVPAAHGDRRNVQLQRNGLGHDAAQIALFDGIGQLILKGKAVEHLAQIAHVAAIRRGGHT